jgi:peptidyl-prolyl cis-trans isomerase D
MISWMQKHNKYLVWTIWVATIAFIGAGFVGWGSYNFGSKAGNIAKVGDIEISQTKLNMIYSNIYNQYNQAMNGTLDDKKAKEMGLVQQAFSRLAIQAKILNFAKKIGIVVSDNEVREKLQAIPAFQKDGVFNKKVYETYLQSQRLKAKTFENTFREELIIQKTISLLSVEALPFEQKVITDAMNISDKIAYQVLTTDDVNLVIDESKIKAFWEMQKENFKTKQKYILSLVWTESNNTQVDEKELKSFYDTNSFNYTDSTGKQLSYEEAKKQVIKDLKLKKTKKIAQKAYIAFKKGKLSEDEKVTLSIGDVKLNATIWNILKDAKVGDILKPKINNDKYVTIKVDNIILPKIKTYEEAKQIVTILYTQQEKKKALLELAEKRKKDFNTTQATLSDFVKLDKNVKLYPLNTEESLQFLQKLFTSTKEKGIISVIDKIVVYSIVDQKIAPSDANQTKFVNQTVNKIKENTFEANLIKILDKQYPTESYVGGLTN